jgi:Ino eighty subunit 1
LQPLASVHFPDDGSLNFLDLFLAKPLSSQDRARVFLWHMYHYLEGPATSNFKPVPAPSRTRNHVSTNPFDNETNRGHPKKAPVIRDLTEAQAKRENIDTTDELKWGAQMSNNRNVFLQKLVSSIEYEKRNRHTAAGPATGTPCFKHLDKLISLS